MLRTILLSTTAVALTVTTALATPTNYKLPNGAALTTVERGQQTAGSYHFPPLTVIFDSIGTGGYNCCSGWTVSGPSSVIGETIWSADQITPTANHRVKKLVVGVGYVTGNNAAQLAIYKNTAAGIPGRMLWSADVSSLPTFGSTSTTTATASVTGVRLRASKPFWVAVQTDSGSSNTWDAWNLSNTTSAPLAQYTSQTGVWTNFGSTSAGAMTVYGR